MQSALAAQKPAQFDVCIANILQGPLLELQPRLCGYLKPGGTLLLSGILTSQVRPSTELSITTFQQVCQPMLSPY